MVLNTCIAPDREMKLNVDGLCRQDFLLTFFSALLSISWRFVPAVKFPGVFHRQTNRAEVDVSTSRELRNHVMFGVGMPNALHCNRTVESTSRVTCDGRIPTNDGLTIKNNINKCLLSLTLLGGLLTRSARGRNLGGWAVSSLGRLCGTLYHCQSWN